MDLKGRIKILSVHLGLSIREFERECGLKRGNIFRDASDAGGKTNCEDEDLPLVIDSMVSNLTNYTELQLRQLKLLQKLIDQNKKERDPLQNR